MAKIDVAKAPAWVRELEGKLHEAALRGVRSAGQRTVGRIHEIVDAEPRKPVDRGTYRGAWRAVNVPEGSLVHNDSPHGSFVEDGVRAENVKPGRKMVDAIAEWVLRKGLVRDVRKADRAQAARGIAWAIVQSMKRRGIFGGTGLKILERARRDVPRFIEEEVRRELSKVR